MPSPAAPADADKLAAYLAERRDLKRTERSNAGKVLRRFAKQVLPMGYHRRSTFFVREAGQIIQFLHLHKFSFGPEFRMHVCIRVLNDSLDGIALCGIVNDGFALVFEDNDESLSLCAKQMTAFVSDIAEPWFSKWREQALIEPGSPIPSESRDALIQALEGNADPCSVHRSRVLLGLRPRADEHE